ncbi:MAG: GNAT family N-acetyltransferase [Lachnospiraceae bacterium]|nr:GNAT family N-acetyltransferase [Lachnospiraceae bacterium]
MAEDDWKSLIRIWDDFSHSKYAKYDVPHTLNETEVQRMVKRWADASPQKEHMFFAVCLENEIIGYNEFHKDADGYECGYCFHSSSQGKGYAKENLQALMKLLSNGYKTRYSAGTALNNLPSVRLLKSLGFEKVSEEQVSFYKDESGEDIYFTGGIFAIEIE